MNRIRMLARNFERAHSIWGINYHVSILLKENASQDAQFFLVFNKKDGFRPLQGPGRCRDQGRPVDGFGDLWQINLENSSLAKFAIDPYMAATLFDDSID